MKNLETLSNQELQDINGGTFSIPEIFNTPIPVFNPTFPILLTK